MTEDTPKHRWIVVAAALALIFTSGPSYAVYFLDGNEVVSLCRSNRSAVTGYVAGIVDYNEMDNMSRQSGGNTPQFCLSETTKPNQISDLICQSLEANPKTRDWPASILVTHYITEAWPCR